MKKQTIVRAVAGLAILWAGAAQAESILGQFTWTTNGGTPPYLDGWTQDGGDTWYSLSNPGSGGNTSGGGAGDGYLNISFSPADPENFGSDWYALTYVDADSLFIGNWANNFVAMDFWAENIEPGYVQIRWAATNGTAWRNTVFDSDLSSMATGVWTTLTSPSLSSNNWDLWDYGSGSAEQFANDLASIDWIGVYIWRNTSVTQDYGLDNFRLMIPEPCQTVMLAAALLTSALSLRRKKKAGNPPTPGHT